MPQASAGLPESFLHRPRHFRSLVLRGVMIISSGIRIVTSILVLSTAASAYVPVREYRGDNFFDQFVFYGKYDNLTLSNALWVDEATAMSQKLAYINDAQNAIMKVDNTSNVQLGQNRSTIRITSTDYYDLGSLWIVDMVHMPWGCSVWPAFWSVGDNWPDGGEIDIVEEINLSGANQMALHTTPGCMHPTPPNQLGQSGTGQGGVDCSTGAGCTVLEEKPNSYGAGFAAAGGGVFATQFDEAGIYMWFWSRADIPQSILEANTNSSISLSDWGNPSGSYPSPACNISEYFTKQKIVFDIALCGDWAGIPQFYDPSCGNQGPTGLCYNDSVVGPGSPRFDNAYFEVSYLRAYTTFASTATQTSGTSKPTSGTKADASNSSAATQVANNLFLRLQLIGSLFVTTIAFAAGALLI